MITRGEAVMSNWAIWAKGFLSRADGERYEAPARAEVEEAKRFISEWADRTSRIQDDTSSFALKYEAERWSRARQALGIAEACGHISNGALIQAALELSVPVKPASGSSLNAVFALSWRRLLGESQRPLGRSDGPLVRNC